MIDRGRAPVRTGAVLLAVLLPAIAAAAATNPPKLTARLTAAQESPPQQFRNLQASGTFAATVKPATNGYRLIWKLAFGGLSGTATSAYIHRGSRGTHGAAMIPLCSPCRSGATGSGYFSPPELTLAREGKLYVNVRTARNPNGEIRGQVQIRGQAKAS